MKQKLLIIARDGALLQRRDKEKFVRFVPGVFRNLFFLSKKTGFKLVKLLKFDHKDIEDNRITYQEDMVDCAFEEQNLSFVRSYYTYSWTLDDEGNHKELLFDKTFLYLSDEMIDFTNSYLIGFDLIHKRLAEELGLKCLLIGDKRDEGAETYLGMPVFNNWDGVADYLALAARGAEVHRFTKETDVYVALSLHAKGDSYISTGIGFFDHLLEQIGKHGGMELTIKVKGDLYTDEHHTIEDTALALGEALSNALGDKRGIERYGFCLPMDDCLCTVAIDLGGRPWLVWDAEFSREKIGEMPTEMLMHFFKSLSDAAKMNINISAKGNNEHHKAEGIFKAFARALRMAVKRDPYSEELPSTKGTL
jgi:imidazoleglycerol-phosphate dehydratase/histidinol-phosphatase